MKPSGSPVTLYGIRDDAAAVSYLVESSGSMVDCFGVVKRELRTSINGLTKTQCFNVLFYARDKCMEFIPKKMVPADEESRADALKYFDAVQAVGYASGPIPALKRAVDSFRATSSRPRDCAVFLITAGAFDMQGQTYKSSEGKDLTGEEAVLAFLKDHNKDRRVRVHVIVVDLKPSVDVEFWLRRIAEENGGEYKCVRGTN